MIVMAGSASLESIGQDVWKGSLKTLRHELRLQFTGGISSTGKPQF